MKRTQHFLPQPHLYLTNKKALGPRRQEEVLPFVTEGSLKVSWILALELMMMIAQMTLEANRISYPGGNKKNQLFHGEKVIHGLQKHHSILFNFEFFWFVNISYYIISFTMRFFSSHILGGLGGALVRGVMSLSHDL